LDFAAFLEDCLDVVSFAKNYLAVHFKLDYINAAGDIANYSFQEKFFGVILHMLVLSHHKSRRGA
jgi:type III restriction enzyme